MIYIYNLIYLSKKKKKSNFVLMYVYTCMLASKTFFSKVRLYKFAHTVLIYTILHAYV